MPTFAPNKFVLNYLDPKNDFILRKLFGSELVFIELLKFKASKIAGEKQQLLWLRFLTEIDESTTEAPADFLDNSDITEALENLKTSAFSKAELEAYDKYWDSVRVELTLQSGYYNKGWAEGKSEAIIETANNGILAGFSNEIIKAMTKLSDDQIDELHREIKIKRI